MSTDPGWVPDEVDTTKASSARVYDYWLGGDHNFQADRDVARAAMAVDPNIRTATRAYRAFLIRAVRYLTAEAGIRQFLDIGSGIPSNQNVHQVAQEIAPGSHVVYVDNDEIAVAHSRFILSGNPDAAAIEADLREPEKILADPSAQLLLDFSQPVGLVLSAVLHFVPDDDQAAAVVATLRDALAPGSYLVIGHACMDGREKVIGSYQKVYNHRVSNQSKVRSRAEIERLCAGFTLLPPGLVWAPQWRPDSPGDVPADPENYWSLVGVARYDGDR
ncbi:MAG: SAM-dependent methyltransferase [Streptosporangiales bacterium]|nr:SAM-dependent methyltransferase [Streptosporangiales bacterium]